MRIFLSIVFILNLFATGLSQSRYVDSIITQLNAIKPDTLRLKKLSSVAQEVMATDCHQAILLAKFGISESEKLKHTNFKLQFKSILGYSYKLAVIVETTCQPISGQYIDERNGQIRDKISTENMTTESAIGK